MCLARFDVSIDRDQKPRRPKNQIEETDLFHRFPP
jgi:hypothetical protein